MSEYPVILIPQSVEAAIALRVPEPPQLVLPPEPNLQLTPKPLQPLPFTKATPKRMNTPVLLVSVVVSTFLAVISASLGFMVGGTAILIAVAYYLSYPSRLEWHLSEKNKREREIQQYPYKELAWERKVDKECRRHAQRVQAWDVEVARIKAAHQRQLAASASEASLNQYRYSCVRRILQRTKSYDSKGSDADKGWAEYPKNCAFGVKLETYFPGKIHMGVRVETFTPDFAYIDAPTGLHIDVEIDEPYTPRQYPKGGALSLIHCTDGHSGLSDRQRDHCFISRGWFVLRFSEEQVICYPDSCCREVAKLISQISGEREIMQSFSGVPELLKVQRWSERIAQRMASTRVRLNYPCKIDSSRQSHKRPVR